MRCPERWSAAPPVAVLIAALLPACPSAEPRDPGPLVLAEDWTRVTDLARDQFAAMRPADAVCDDAGWSVDPFRLSLEVETEVCNYLTVQQPTRMLLLPGDSVNVLGLHDVLSSDTSATGYLGLSIDGELVWELEIEIPADAAAIDETFTIEREFPAGSDAQFHVHNHGPNSWELIAVEVTPAG